MCVSVCVCARNYKQCLNDNYKQRHHGYGTQYTYCIFSRCPPSLRLYLK